MHQPISGVDPVACVLRSLDGRRCSRDPALIRVWPSRPRALCAGVRAGGPARVCRFLYARLLLHGGYLSLLVWLLVGVALPLDVWVVVTFSCVNSLMPI